MEAALKGLMVQTEAIIYMAVSSLANRSYPLTPNMAFLYLIFNMLVFCIRAHNLLSLVAKLWA